MHMLPPLPQPPGDPRFIPAPRIPRFPVPVPSPIPPRPQIPGRPAGRLRVRGVDRLPLPLARPLRVPPPGPPPPPQDPPGGGPPPPRTPAHGDGEVVRGWAERVAMGGGGMSSGSHASLYHGPLNAAVPSTVGPRGRTFWFTVVVGRLWARGRRRFHGLRSGRWDAPPGGGGRPRASQGIACGA